MVGEIQYNHGSADSDKSDKNSIHVSPTRTLPIDFSLKASDDPHSNQNKPMLNSRRHKNVSKNFEDMTFKEQNQAMNRNALQFRRQLIIHLRKAKADGRCTREVLNGRVRLLGRIFENHAKEIETPEISL